MLSLRSAAVASGAANAKFTLRQLRRKDDVGGKQHLTVCAQCGWQGGEKPHHSLLVTGGAD